MSVVQNSPIAPYCAPLVLIVDDAVHLLEPWKILLEGAGLRVVTAHSGPAGLAEARIAHPDLIITDYMMPGMDGLAFCRAIRAEPTLSGTPMILWTAAAIEIRTEGFERLMRKPVFFEELLEIIHEILPDPSRTGFPA